MKLRFGTRGSKLALFQTRLIIGRVRDALPELEIEEIIIKTLGDRVTDLPLFKVGGQGLFIKEIEAELQSGRIDLAVHSLKDMPHALGEGLVLGAVPEREDARDVLLARDGWSLATLPDQASIGTSSLRRRAQLAAARPDLRFTDLRGNLDTRLRKLHDGEVDAIVLAAAGLHRLGWNAGIREYFPVSRLVPAAGQGLLGIECRAADLDRLKQVLAVLEEKTGRLAATTERAFLAELRGGCQTPLGVHAEIRQRVIRITAFIGNPSGETFLRFRGSAAHGQAEALGRQAARALLNQGAERFLPSNENDDAT